MVLVVVVSVVALALVVGAVWGAFGRIPELVEGLLLATASGALVTALTFELVEPAVESAGVGPAMVGLAIGAMAFTAIDFVIDEVWSGGSGLGIMAAVTLDGVPENLALGVALVGASAGDVAALAVAIVVSDFPEAAGGAQDLADAGWSRLRNIGMWMAVAALLSIATVAGQVLFDEASDTWLGVVSVFAAGAVRASLATEVIPEAFQQARHGAGLAITAGFVVTILLTG